MPFRQSSATKPGAPAVTLHDPEAVQLKRDARNQVCQRGARLLPELRDMLTM
jgi:hypothetical protein